MVKDPIRRHGDTVGEEALRARTGRGREEWFAAMDAAGVRDLGHRRIAAWLVEEHGVDGWWAQSLTVGYEQSRGLRVPGQRPDGTFEAGVSATLPVPVDAVFACVAEPERRARWLDVEPEVRGATPHKTVRWTWPDGTRVLATVTELPGGRTRVSLTQSGLPDADALAPAKEYWRERMAALRELLTDRA
ncbi:DUF4287 domain-containing protein [Actinotalea subterranea]|uniref:DUF4287 domain-containing protein n=1 Tax=Actinotalea subterranea TaxID=2607497 RepID=UPI0011EEB746|nr:DUF4287 domain-containing protein [Actinotalea subterranea]